MDRNTVIGFILIGALLIGMFYFNSKSNLAYQAELKRIADSTRNVDSLKRLKFGKDTVALKADLLKYDSTKKVQAAGGLIQATDNKEQLTVLENDVVKITFTNKGAQPKIVELKNYKTYNGKTVTLLNSDFDKISYQINTGSNLTTNTSDLFFKPGLVTENTGKSKSVTFSIADSSGKEIKHEFTLKSNDYLLDFTIFLHGADKLISQNMMNLSWQTQTAQIENDLKYEKQQTHLCHFTNDKYDFELIGNSDNDKKFENPVDWLAVKQQFFIKSLIDKEKFKSADVKWTVPTDTSLHIIAQTVANCRIPLSAGSSVQVPLQLYYGPSDFNILKKYDNRMENIVPFGSGIFAFVKYINRYLLLPAFDFLKMNVASMGLVILLLTLLIRLITSPILYKSYVSGAKMKALKPEIDALKKKFGDDKQAFGVEQMKLWKSAGVNPLGGCLPALLQIPIFMSLYYFFQSNIGLRGQNFLWAKDLAQYDSIAHFSFSIPFYGDHVSLFTLTATITSLVISLYSMNSMQQDDSNPVMKYMPYIFPVMLLGVFNGLPAALTWYYTISNTITLILQIVIQKYIIDHDKILAQLEENKKKPVKQSKLQERIQAMQDANKKIQDLKDRTQKK